jgi:hypothetical protein
MAKRNKPQSLSILCVGWAGSLSIRIYNADVLSVSIYNALASDNPIEPA